MDKNLIEGLTHKTRASGIKKFPRINSKSRSKKLCFLGDGMSPLDKGLTLDFKNRFKKPKGSDMGYLKTLSCLETSLQRVGSLVG